MSDPGTDHTDAVLCSSPNSKTCYWGCSHTLSFSHWGRWGIACCSCVGNIDLWETLEEEGGMRCQTRAQVPDIWTCSHHVQNVQGRRASCPWQRIWTCAEKGGQVGRGRALPLNPRERMRMSRHPPYVTLFNDDFCLCARAWKLQRRFRPLRERQSVPAVRV